MGEIGETRVPSPHRSTADKFCPIFDGIDRKN